MKVLLWLAISLLINFLPATLGYLGMVIAMEPNPGYWKMYFVVWFVLTLPLNLYNTMRAGARGQL